VTQPRYRRRGDSKPHRPPSNELRSAFSRCPDHAYLGALVTGLGNDDLSDLPNMQAQQRAHIIGWRTDLAVFGRKAHLRLSADLELAGRGEIAPSAKGGS
jgi:hypothetical protein